MIDYCELLCLAAERQVRAEIQAIFTNEIVLNIDPIQRQVRIRGPLSADHRGGRPVPVRSADIDARFQSQQVQRVPIQERQVLDLLLLHRAGYFRIRCVHYFGARFNRDRLFGWTHFQLDRRNGITC